MVYLKLLPSVSPRLRLACWRRAVAVMAVPASVEVTAGRSRRHNAGGCTALDAIDVVANDHDTDGDALSVAIETYAPVGTASVNAATL